MGIIVRLRNNFPIAGYLNLYSACSNAVKTEIAKEKGIVIRNKLKIFTAISFNELLSVLRKISIIDSEKKYKTIEIKDPIKIKTKKVAVKNLFVESGF
jgi:hypothetical protein